MRIALKCFDSVTSQSLRGSSCAAAVGRQFKRPASSQTDAMYDDLLLISGQLNDHVSGCGCQSVPASLGVVTSRRVKDEVNAARKLELVTNTVTLDKLS